MRPRLLRLPTMEKVYDYLIRPQQELDVSKPRPDSTPELNQLRGKGSLAAAFADVSSLGGTSSSTTSRTGLPIACLPIVREGSIALENLYLLVFLE